VTTVERQYGGVTVLAAEGGGAYPAGNSLLVRGSAATLLADPSTALDGPVAGVDLVVASHAHEDHLAGLHHFAGVPVHAHHSDLAAVRDRETLLAGYGLPPEATDAFRRTLVEEFHIVDRPDAVGVVDGAVFDLGDRTVTVVHLPGHTAGHCGLLVEPDGFCYVADIDLSGFGPYYGDVGSSLEAFEHSVRRAAGIDARWFGTFHQKGVIEGAAEFRQRLATFWSVAARREDALLALLAEPRTLDDVVAHRIVYRPHVEAPYVETVERRSAEQHLARLLAQGKAVEIEPGVFRANGR
jgi:glyoxylase-like metal-dependent hydrolase (beta-lactamase superfamily II)